MAKKGGGRVESALRNPSYLRVANILGFKNLDSNNDVDAIEDYIKKNGDPYQNALDAANQATEDIRNKGINDLNSLTTGFTDSINQLNSDFDTRYDNLRDSSNSRIGELQGFIDSQRSSFDTAISNQRTSFEGLLRSQADEFAVQRDQLNGLLITSQEANTALQGTLDEQNRIATNQANAFVPGSNPSAVGATAGDDREQLFSSTKKKSSKQLNDLSLLSGVGTQGNPLAGLQIA